MARTKQLSGDQLQALRAQLETLANDVAEVAQTLTAAQNAGGFPEGNTQCLRDLSREAMLIARDASQLSVTLHGEQGRRARLAALDAELQGKP